MDTDKILLFICDSILKDRLRMPTIWSAVTCHRFGRRADLSARQSRVQRLGKYPCATAFDGDKSPAESGENSPHSTAPWLRRKSHQIHPFPSVVKTRLPGSVMILYGWLAAETNT